MNNEHLIQKFLANLPVPVREYGDLLFTITSTETLIDSEPPDPDDPWDRGDSYYSQHINSPVYVNRKILDQIKERKAYVLWAQYSTGDTFGHDAGACVAILAISLKNDEKLDEIEKAYLTPKHAKKLVLPQASFPEWANYFKDDNIPWVGYFESLDSINITEVELEEKPK